MVLCQCSVILCLSGTRHEAGYVTRESGRRVGGTDGRASRTGGDVTRTDARRVTERARRVLAVFAVFSRVDLGLSEIKL
jgi:hypothetical protein